jgi:ribosome-associated heat shock protein Hsp15
MTTGSAGIRLDKWLFYARFFRSRERAGELCRSGRLRVNGLSTVKPDLHVRPGDVLTFTLGRKIRIVRIVAVGARRGPAPEARQLYEDLAMPAAAAPEQQADQERPHTS